MGTTEELEAWGHANIVANHKSTLEIIKEVDLSVRGDCIIAVGANRSLFDLSPQFKKLAQSDKARIIMKLVTNDFTEEVKGWGSPKLSFESRDGIVCRTSTFVDERTLMIKADKAAVNLSRGLITKLQSDTQLLKVQIIVEHQP